MRRYNNLLASVFVFVVWTTLIILFARDIYNGLNESGIFRVKPRTVDEMIYGNF